MKTHLFASHESHEQQADVATGRNHEEDDQEVAGELKGSKFLTDVLCKQTY